MNIKTLELDNVQKSYRYLKGTDITPKDDAFHGNIHLMYLQQEDNLLLLE